MTVGCFFSSTARISSGGSAGSQYFICNRADVPDGSSSRMTSGFLPSHRAATASDAAAPKRDVSADSETLPCSRIKSSTISADAPSFSQSASPSEAAGIEPNAGLSAKNSVSFERAAGGSMACIASPVVQSVCSFINRISPSISPSSESSREQTAKRGLIFAGSVSELSRSTVQIPVTRRLPLPKGTLTKSPGLGDIPSGMR